MVATLSPVSSTDAAERYYLDNQASMRPKADYYAVGKEPDGVWLNPNGMFGLPDRERVTTADFHKLFWGFSPEDGSKLSRNAGSAARSAAIDITFSPDKSISALWAIAPPELRTEIERIHNDAAREAFERFIIGECAYTRRIGRDGKLEAARADLIAAMFQHGESREQDPQLHTHIVCFNVAHTPDDGKYRTHYQWPAFMWIKTMGPWYRAAVASGFQEKLGIRMEQYGENNEFIRIAGMPEDLIKTWSKRRGQIVAWAKSQGLNIAANPAHGQAANLNPRKHKDNLGDDQARRERWRRESLPTLPDLGTFIREIVGHNLETSPEDIRELADALRTVPDDLMRAEAVVRLPEIIAEVARRCGAKLKTAAIDTAVARLLRDPAFVHLEPRPTFDSAAGLRHTEVSTTKHTLLLEETVTELAKSMQDSTAHGIDAAAVDAKIAALKADNYPVSGEQIDAIRAAATSDGRIAVIEGAAGSGKTTTLRPLADLWRDAGKKIIATAVPWRTAMALGTDVDAPMLSVAKLLSMAARDRLDVDRNSVIVADEAGMLSTREIHHLMQLSEKTGAKIVFCGDTQQQQPVEAGPGLRLVRDVVGSSRIAMIRRQKADIEDILRHRHGISPEEARAEAETTTAAERDRIVAEFEASPQASDPPFRPWQIATSEAFRDGDTHHAIASLRDRGRFHLCRNGDVAIEQIADDVSRYTKENPGKSLAVLARTNHERRGLSAALRRHALGDEPRNPHVIQVSDREDGRHRTPLEIAEGDRLRIGATHWQKQLFNGSVVIVDRLSAAPGSGDGEPSIRIDGHTEDGRAVSFNHDEIRDYYGNIRLDHGYALTITSAQGLTVDAAFLLADSRSARETMYPAATRHRESLNIYVDRKTAAYEIGTSRIDHDKVDQIVTDDEIVEHLAKSWKRSSPKQAAHDYRIRQRREPRPDGPDIDPPPGSAPEIDRLVRDDRERALELRYGNEVAALASGRRQVLQSYAELRARAAAGENVADEPAFRETLERHAVLVTAAERFRTRPHKFARLLKRRGGMTADDLQDFRHRLKRARDWRRGRAISRTTAGRAPQTFWRRGAPRRADPRQPLPDRVVQDIERDLEALAPAGPPLGDPVTSISTAGDVAHGDGAVDLDAAAALDRAWQEQPTAPDAGGAEGDWSEAAWSDEDLADYADSMERSAAIAAPDAGAEMPEDPGWADYAASLDAGGGPPPEAAPRPPDPAPRDETGSAPQPPLPLAPDAARDPAPPPPAAPAISPTDAEFELFERRRRALGDAARRNRANPWRSPDWPPLRTSAQALLRRPDLSESRRARGHLGAVVRSLDAHAADLVSMTAETREARTPLDSHTGYPEWLRRGAEMLQAAPDVLAACARVVDPGQRHQCESAVLPELTRLGKNLRLAAAIADARRDLAPAVAQLKARAAAVRIADDLTKLLRTQPRREHPVDGGRLLHYVETSPYIVWSAAVRAGLNRARTEMPSIFAARADSLSPVPAVVRRRADALHSVLNRNRNADRADDLFDDIRSRAETMTRETRKDGLSILSHPDAPAIRRRAGLLRRRADAGDAIRAPVDRFIAGYDGRIAARDRVASVRDDLVDHRRLRDTIRIESAERDIHPAEHPDHAAWTSRVDGLKADADAILRDTETYQAHLNARPGVEAEIRANAAHLVAVRDDDLASLAFHEAQRLDRELQAHIENRHPLRQAAIEDGIPVADHPDYNAWKAQAEDLIEAIDLLLRDPTDDDRFQADPGLEYSLSAHSNILADTIRDDMHNLALLSHRPQSAPALEPASTPIPGQEPERSVPDTLADPARLDRELQTHIDARYTIHEAAIAAEIPIASHPDYETWKSRADDLIKTANVILCDTAPYRDHFEADPGLNYSLTAYSEILADTIADDMRNLAISRPAPDPQPDPEPTPEPDETKTPDISPDLDTGPGIGF